MVRGITKNEQSIFSDVKASAVADAYKRLMFPALERDIRNELTESADEQAIKVFGVNLKTSYCNHHWQAMSLWALILGIVRVVRWLLSMHKGMYSIMVLTI